MKFRSFRGQQGISLLETLLAVALLAIIGIAFLSALRTISQNTGVYEERVTAERLAQSQIELIKAAPYSSNYSSVSLPDSMPPGYNIAVSAAENITGEQQIMVAVSKDGRPIIMLQTIKVDW